MQMEGFGVRAPERRIQVNPFDVDAWNLLLRENLTRQIDQCREFYESLVKQFPNSGRYWKAYIEHELRSKNFENVEKLFSRCLVNVLNIDLWKSYIHYVHETKGSLNSFREKMAQAYDFTIEKVGLDVHAYSIYSDYIAFLKKVPAVGQYAENQRITAVRKVYLKALGTPLFASDNLWPEYCAYEKGINAMLAEKLIAERNKEHTNAKKVERTLENLTRGLNRQSVSVPPRGTAAEMKQLELWRKYIQWEKSNPLETDEYSQFAKRVCYVYEQALLCLGYYPDIWFEAALFTQTAAKTLEEKGDVKSSQHFTQETIQLFEKAIAGMMKESPLLYFAYGDFEEKRIKYDNVKKIYDKLIEIEHVNPTLAYIQYMKFARRTEGVKSARLVFKRAREDPRSGHHVYIAAALLEYYCSKDKDIAMRIFDLGLKKYGGEPDFAASYVDFLSHLNEDNNTRLIFERVLTSGQLPINKAVKIWDRYLDFESTVGDLSSVHKVEERRKEAMETENEPISSSQLVVDRYRFMNLFPCTSEQLKLIGYHEEKHYDGGATSSGAANAPTQSSSSTRGPQAASVIMGGAGVTSAVIRHGFPRPDIAQMIPYKPRFNAHASSHPIPGGIFPPPPAAAQLVQMMPPPTCFQGPFVDVDKLIHLLSNYRPPNTHNSKSDKLENGTMLGPMLVEDVKKDFYQLLATTTDPNAVVRSSDLTSVQKRKRADSDDEEEGAATSGSRDVYKRRMNQRVHE